MNEQNIGYRLGKLFRRITGISWASSTEKAETESNPSYNIIEEDNDDSVSEIKVFEEYRNGNQGYGYYSATGYFLGDYDTYMDYGISDENE
ncbi:hypothetical protein [Exercitatus varius]|uniref:hypothetical protein n=1 Tax=Exercitatus varius TaxID=67857 RepID=UPI00294B009A|nr:hypothetical protein [Exercitatus varius]MDG2961704.1 hypothetical protein [Exercitatus varius]